MSIETKNNLCAITKRFALRPDGRELPPYLVAAYRDSIVAARQKLDRLGRLSLAELERPHDDRGGRRLIGIFERKQRAKTLNRWLRETKGIINELMRLFHDLRDDQAILEEYVLERFGRPPT